MNFYNFKFRKDRTIFFNQKKKTIFYQRFLLVFFILMVLSTYVIYEFFLFTIHINDDDMSPNLIKGSIAIFRVVTIETSEDFIKIPRGAVIAIDKPGNPPRSVLRDIFDIPVFLLSLGWIKLNHREVIVRRILAYPGEKLEIKNKVVYLNKKIFLPEWIIKYQDAEIFPEKVTPRDNLAERYIDKNKIFVINDDWDRINDSRLFKQIDISSIRGIMIYIVE